MTRIYSARSGTSICAELLDRADVGRVLQHRGQVVEPVGDRDELDIGAHLGELFDAAVQVAHIRLAVDDDLAVERDGQPQHAVGARVLRAHIDLDMFGPNPG